MRSYVETAVAAPRQADHLDTISELAGHRDIEIGNLRYTLTMNRIRVDEAAKRERREDRDLVSDIETFDVVGRVGLGEPQALRLGERFIEALAAGFHRGENVVGGSVEDSRDS